MYQDEIPQGGWKIVERMFAWKRLGVWNGIGNNWHFIHGPCEYSGIGFSRASCILFIALRVVVFLAIHVVRWFWLEVGETKQRLLLVTIILVRVIVSENELCGFSLLAHLVDSYETWSYDDITYELIAALLDFKATRPVTRERKFCRFRRPYLPH